MKSKFRILPWLGLAMVMCLGGQPVQADEAVQPAAPAAAQEQAAAPAAPVAEALAAPTISIDTTELKNGGTIKVSGKAPAGKPVTW